MLPPIIYDYDKQSYVRQGRWVDCGHPEAMECECYGRLHHGERLTPEDINRLETYGEFEPGDLGGDVPMDSRLERLYDQEGDEIEDRRLPDGTTFANPGSALRSATEQNPRNLPCPNCGEPDRLTPADRDRGYQCDQCADRAEGSYYGADY